MKGDNKFELTFTSLTDTVLQIHDEFAAQASRAVNASLTLRNWLIGFYIREYEQNGKDRAKYGDNLLERLSDALSSKDLKRMDVRELRRYRQFYMVYPQIRETLTPEFTARFQVQMKRGDAVSQITQPLPASVSALPSDLVQKLSFSHIAELIAIDDNTKRAFYEIECILGNWSVRELKRQIHSLYYERSGLSLDKKKLSELTRQGAESAKSQLNIRDPYIFEFLGLKPKEVMSESHLEDQLNTYVSWYRKNIMTSGDNPPVGILLCTDKNHALVEYALAGMDNNLFVSKYQLELPRKEDMQRFIEEQLKSEG